MATDIAGKSDSCDNQTICRFDFLTEEERMTPDTFAVKLRERGQMTIPLSVREEWPTRAGDVITLVKFDGFAVIAPFDLKTPSLAEQFSKIMDEEGITLADLLEGAAEERRNSDRLQHPDGD
jgi:bifunctional DNA-binding transcriptional regulator/antitoxin component of YhaV-PrlF toxin-antitoxin module